MKGIKTKEPAVMMAALDVFQEIGKIADYDFMATDGEFLAMPLMNPIR
jgi:SCY1-like protein 2